MIEEESPKPLGLEEDVHNVAQSSDRKQLYSRQKYASNQQSDNVQRSFSQPIDRLALKHARLAIRRMEGKTYGRFLS